MIFKHIKPLSVGFQISTGSFYSFRPRNWVAPVDSNISDVELSDKEDGIDDDVLDPDFTGELEQNDSRPSIASSSHSDRKQTLM